jgi:hypothetical protein
MFQKNLPKIILKQDHDLTKKLKIIECYILWIYKVQCVIWTIGS